MNALPRILARFTFLRCLALLGLMLGASSPALAAKTYSDNGDGTVTDPTTGLIWMRCSMGQTWDGSTCLGTGNLYLFSEANALSGTVTFAGQSDWRLPNIRELQTIADRAPYAPGIDLAAFPNTPDATFSSASANAGFSNYVWHFNHFYAYTSIASVNSIREQVRLVRAGQSSDLLNISRPSTDYKDQGDGTALHIPSGLIWQRCAVGQSWAGGTCSGSAGTFDWDSAQLQTSSFAGHSDWRVPTQQELLSLVDYSRYLPSINDTLFPNTPADAFWSSAGNSSYAWYVAFNYGDAISLQKNFGLYVRLVRGGQFLGSLALNVAKTGVGTVSSSALAGIACGATCTGSYTEGTHVILHASPAANLITWGGACASAGITATCTVTMDAAKSVAASFVDIPVISGLPTSLTFALQNIGSTSVAQHATLTNTGTAALTISSIAASGDYALSHNCGIGLSVGSFCTLNITFTPTASGIRTGSVTITSNAPGSPHSIALSGTGQGSISVASPSALSFSAQGVGTTSAAQTVTLSNTGGAVLNIASIVANGDFARSTSCGASLAQSASCTISVTFTPTATGAHLSTLVITSDAISSPTTVSLNGTGAPVALVSLSPSALSFAAQVVGTSSTAQTVTLSNTGGATLNLTTIDASAEFLVTNNCGGGLGAGGVCSLNVTFTPAALGTRSGAVTIISNASGSPHSLSLTGSGTSPNAPVCTLSAAPAKVRKGETSTLTASCSPAATSYSWTGGNCGGTTASSCIEAPGVTTTYSVTGTNAYGSSTASAQITVRNIDLTPILMLLLDD